MSHQERTCGNHLPLVSWAGRFYASHRLLCWTMAVIILPSIALALWLYLMLLRSLPQLSGTLPEAGIRAQVTISRDRHGAVHIEARHDLDVYYALGLAHAQDRLWQLEIQRRMARGEMSEIFGRGSLQFDVFVRTLGIRDAAAASLEGLSEQARSALSAYAAGINSWIDSGRELPSEFQILRVRPQRWAAVDCLAWLKLFALSMSLNYRQELDALSLSLVLDESRRRSMPPPLSSGAPVTVSNEERTVLAELARLSDLGRQMETLLGVGKYVGSNAWVIAGRHMQDGRAILANDPHMGLQIPSPWYVASLKGEHLEAAGMTLVGLPVVLLGRNAHIAWGATNMMADTQDLYFEQLSTEHPDRYLHQGQWLAFAERVEIFRVKADFPAVLREPLAPVRIKIRSTVNGPLISDAVGMLQQPVSLKWVGGSRADTSFEAFLRTNYARSWSDFNAAMALHVAPALNLVYIDAQQNIGYLGAGHLPIRGRGRGKAPLPGWLAENAWQGFVPFAQMPRSFNPPKGYVVTANNQAVDESYPYFISEDWAEPARARRIEALIQDRLARGEKLSAADQQRIQQDRLDLQALALLPQLLSVRATDPQLAGLVRLLADWDGSTGQDSIASTVFFVWLQHLRTRLFADELQASWGKPQLQAQLQLIVQDLSLTQIQAALQAGSWCDDISSASIQSCQDIKLEALRDAQRELQNLLGADEDDWTWSQAQQVLFAHRPFSSIRGADLIYERRSAAAGSPNSINVAAGSYDRNSGFTQTYGAAFRQLMQLDSRAALHWYMNSTGQSGNVFSRHYDDMIEAYLAGTYYSLPHSEHVLAHKLRLTPVPAQPAGALPGQH